MATILASSWPRVRPSRDALAAFLATRAGQALALLLVALAARVAQFGNATLHVDDQFYLLVGDRMWHGVLPFVDIWDRKPIGLFLIYAVIRLLPGDGVLAYQLVATGFAAATAWLITRAASRIADLRGAYAAGIVYLCMLDMFGGDGGQTPVFYGAFVASAALLCIRAIERPAFDLAAQRLAAGAMLAMGLAIQIKYTALFEGAWFGLAMAHALWRSGPLSPRRAVWIAGWMALGLLPTLLALLYYVEIGQGAAFVYANFGSIFARKTESASVLIGRLLGHSLQMAPLVVTAVLARWPDRARALRVGRARAVQDFVIGWAAAAYLGVLFFGSYFDHYFLPLLVPFAVAAAPLLGGQSAWVAVGAGERRYRIGMSWFLLVYSIAFSVAVISAARSARGDGTQARALAAFIRPRLHGCLFVYDGEPILYHLTGSCVPSRWAFPDHLNNKREDGAIGVDPLAEVRRIMATHPHLVVASNIGESKINMRTFTYMQDVLARDYRPIAQIPIGRKMRMVFERRLP